MQRIITDLAVIDVTPSGLHLVLVELAPGVTEDEVREKTERPFFHSSSDDSSSGRSGVETLLSRRLGGHVMGKVIAITTSVDGYVTGPDDKPGTGLGVGGERLHYWAFGGPWTYESERDFGGMSDAGQGVLTSTTWWRELGGGIVRGMYEAAGAWGGTTRSARSSC